MTVVGVVVVVAEQNKLESKTWETYIAYPIKLIPELEIVHSRSKG